MKPRKCKWCGRDYVGSHNSKYCPDCRNVAKSSIARERRARKQRTGNSLVLTAVAARQAGMTYGKYVASRRAQDVQAK